MTVVELELAGALLLKPAVHQDLRGWFSKPFQEATVVDLVPEFRVREVFWSESLPGVARGLHLQTPPAAVAKLVFVVSGRVRDVMLDLRAGSPTYLHSISVELDRESGAVFVPRGVAHGFEVVDGPAITCYLQDGAFDPTADSGVAWASTDLGWCTDAAVMSPRDRGLPRLADFPTITECEWNSRV